MSGLPGDYDNWKTASPPDYSAAYERATESILDGIEAVIADLEALNVDFQTECGNPSEAIEEAIRALRCEWRKPADAVVEKEKEK